MSDLPVPALVALGLLVVVQAVLFIVALVDLARRPTDQVAGSNKWLWLAVILFVSTLGAILHLAIGRKPAATVAGPTSAGPRAVRPEDVAGVSLPNSDPGNPRATGPEPSDQFRRRKAPEAFQRLKSPSPAMNSRRCPPARPTRWSACR